MAVGVLTHMEVEVVNTLVTVIATALLVFLSPGLQKWLARRYWERTARGNTTDILVSEGFSGFSEFVWKVRHSTGTDRIRVIRDLLPYVVVIAMLQLLPYSTAGIGATAFQKDGSSVKVIGSLATPSGEVIETLSLDTLKALRRGEIEGGAAPFLLGSPELGNYGTNVTGLDWRLSYSDSDETNMMDLTIFGDNYNVEQDGAGNGTFTVSTCLTVKEDKGVYSVGTCGGLRTELETHEVVVEAVRSVNLSSEICNITSTLGVFNQGVLYKERVLTLNHWDGNFTEDGMVQNTTVTAVCANIYESRIEACIFEVGDHIYVGDWNPYDLYSCGRGDEPMVDMYIIEINRGGGVLPSRDEFTVAISMLAEIVGGSGTVYSRQQLALVIGVFSRLAAMKLGVGKAYLPENIVMISISRVVLLIWGVLLVGGFVIHLRERRFAQKVFIPSSAWDWFAVGARECSRDQPPTSGPPSAHHYAANYGAGKPRQDFDETVEHLSWTVKQPQDPIRELEHPVRQQNN